MEEFPVQELHGHTSDILDLAWSNSNCLLSPSKDKTVRLWKVGHDKCLGVFNHKNYVTCTQFSPVDENYFISGSIDGKVRIWGVNEKRVVDWADVRDVITAICYHSNGKLVPSLVLAVSIMHQAMISYLLQNFKFKVKRDARAIESPASSLRRKTPKRL